MGIILKNMLAAQIVAGLDEGIASMKPGGLRRLYIPGNLSFPKGLPSVPGRSATPHHHHAPVALLIAEGHCQVPGMIASNWQECCIDAVLRSLGMREPCRNP